MWRWKHLKKTKLGSIKNEGLSQTELEKQEYYMWREHREYLDSYYAIEDLKWAEEQEERKKNDPEDKLIKNDSSDDVDEKQDSNVCLICRKWKDEHMLTFLCQICYFTKLVENKADLHCTNSY